MPSLRSRLFLFVLRHRHLLRFKFRGETAVDWENNLAQVRRSADKAARMLGRVPKGVAWRPVSIHDGLAAEWILPAGAGAPDRAILYFHGGGYVLGSIQAHRGIVSKFVKASGLGALLFDYRLAPEHPFPAGLEDAMAAYEWLLDQGLSPAHIVFAGDSAGGGLGLACLIALRDRGLPLPAAAVALSPWTDVACTGESYRTRARVCLSPPGSWEASRKHYVGDGDPCRPLVSPLYGDLEGLPPLLVLAGEDEVLRDDSIRFAHKAEQAGVDVTLRVEAGMCHCYPACAPLFPEASRAMAEIGAFIQAHVDQPRP